MKPNAIKGARVIRWLLAAATLLLAALLIVQFADVYRVGTSPANLSETGVRLQDVYSREIVAERFGAIRWAFVVWLALFVAAMVASVLAPDKGAVKPYISPESRLERLLLGHTQTPGMLAEEKKRRLLSIVCAVVCLACAALVAAYFLDLSHFASRELESVVGAMLLRIAPWVAIAFAAIALLTYLGSRSILRELDMAKAAPGRSPEPPAARSPMMIVGRVALYIAAAALLIAGVVNGGMYDMLVKAINICTECIGLG